MKTLNDISSNIDSIFITKWQRREGLVVPDASSVKLGNDAIDLDVAVLYADLEDSTGLVSGYKDWFAAEIYKAYLVSCCEIIKNNSGVITAFDGDRVMAVFMGESKNSNAAKAGLQINYIVKNVINPKIKERYPETSYQIAQAVGIDTSKIMVARTGIRGDNDLVWVGNAANIAAKMCGLRVTPYRTFISNTVFEMLCDTTKYGGTDRHGMWQKINWPERNIPIYASSWTWKPD